MAGSTRNRQQTFRTHKRQQATSWKCCTFFFAVFCLVVAFLFTLCISPSCGNLHMHKMLNIISKKNCRLRTLLQFWMRPKFCRTNSKFMQSPYIYAYGKFRQLRQHYFDRSHLRKLSPVIIELLTINMFRFYCERHKQQSGRRKNTN